jgi:hypothetical protein
MKKLTGLAIFLLTFLVACALPALPIPANNSVTPTITPTPPPTKPFLTATASATLSPDSLTAQAISDAENKKLDVTDTTFFSFCNNLIPEWGYTSGKHIKEIAPDWVVIECHSSNGSERIQKFIYKRGLKIWTITLSDVSLFQAKDKYNTSLDIELLTKGNKDVYLSPSYHLKDGTAESWNPLMALQYKTGLYRLNLEKGNFDALLDPNTTPGDEFAYAISPDETWLAFAKASEKNIFYVRDLRKGTDKKIELKSDIENIGAFVWTPDSKKVIFVAAPTGWRENKAGTFIYAYDPITSQTTVIVYSDSQQRMPFPDSSTTGKSYWLQKNFLNLISAQNGLDQWKLDIRNGYIGAAATPTPKP